MPENLIPTDFEVSSRPDNVRENALINLDHYILHGDDGIPADPIASSREITGLPTIPIPMAEESKSPRPPGPYVDPLYEPTDPPQQYAHASGSAILTARQVMNQGISLGHYKMKTEEYLPETEQNLKIFTECADRLIAIEVP